MTVKDRIKEFCKAENMTISAFESSIGVANGYVNAISKSIGLDKIEVILEKYPNINLEWLFVGKGNMYKDGCSAQAESDTGNIERRLIEIEKKQEIRDKEMESIMKTLEKISSELEERDKNHHSLCG